MSTGYNTFVGSDEYRNMLVVNGHLDELFSYFYLGLGSSRLDMNMKVEFNVMLIEIEMSVAVKCFEEGVPT